jgi:hypothetical protein
MLLQADDVVEQDGLSFSDDPVVFDLRNNHLAARAIPGLYAKFVARFYFSIDEVGIRAYLPSLSTGREQ